MGKDAYAKGERLHWIKQARVRVSKKDREQSAMRQLADVLGDLVAAGELIDVGGAYLPADYFTGGDVVAWELE